VKSSRVAVTKRGDTWSGCRLSSGRWTVLAEDADEPSYSRRISRPTIAGDYVALVDETVQYSGLKSVTIDVSDSRTWKYPEGVRVDDASKVEELALSPDGWVAWRSRHESPEKHEEAIGIHDGAGTRLLDSGPIGAFTGPVFTSPSRVAWTRDGVQHEASAQAAP
jgi:hypothetical protein